MDLFAILDATPVTDQNCYNTQLVKSTVCLQILFL